MEIILGIIVFLVFGGWIVGIWWLCKKYTLRGIRYMERKTGKRYLKRKERRSIKNKRR